MTTKTLTVEIVEPQLHGVAREMIDPATVEATDDAYFANVHGRDDIWYEPARLPCTSRHYGRKCVRVYEFSAEEIARAGEDASELPWDDAHVDHIRLID